MIFVEGIGSNIFMILTLFLKLNSCSLVTTSYMLESVIIILMSKVANKYNSPSELGPWFPTPSQNYQTV